MLTKQKEIGDKVQIRTDCFNARGKVEEVKIKEGRRQLFVRGLDQTFAWWMDEENEFLFELDPPPAIV